MKRGESFPEDQAEIQFSEIFLEFLSTLNPTNQLEILSEVAALCLRPWGKHTLSNHSNHSNQSDSNLVGWNTLSVLNNQYRVIFKSTINQGVGLIEVLCAGKRSNDAIYDFAAALQRSGRLTYESMIDIWNGLALLEIVSERIGLDGWDYQPAPANTGLIKTAVSAGLFEEHLAQLLSTGELNAAMKYGWDDAGVNQGLALQAVMAYARDGVEYGDLTRILNQRREPRCGAIMPRANRKCIRRTGHPGAHRALA